MRHSVFILLVGQLVAALLLRAPPSAAGNATLELTRPRTVLLIRHAEKPDDKENIHLTAMGKRRAEALPNLFKKSDTRPQPFPKPDFIFASKQSKHSNRSVETVTPLAKEMNLYLNSEYGDDESEKLADELLGSARFAGKTVLVCWHHSTLPDLARSLKAADVPGEFKEHFDRVWVVTYDAQGKGKLLAKRHQELLPGDSKE